MTAGDESLERAFELDLLIEARRVGELSGGDVPAWALPFADLAADLGALGREAELPDEDAVWSRVADELTAARESEVAGDLAGLTSPSAMVGLDTLGREITVPDEDAVWSRVSAGMAGVRTMERISRTVPWWRVGPFGRHPLLWGPVGAAAAVLVVVALILARPPINSAEAFVRDVEALSALAAVALADDVLTEREKDSVAELATALHLTIDQRPETLIELDAEARQNVLATLADVMARLTPIADDELVALRGGPLPGLATAREAVEGGDDDGQAAPEVTQAAGAIEGSTPELDAAESGRGLNPGSDEAPSEPRGLGYVAPVVASSVTSLHEVADAVQGAGQGIVSRSESLGTPGYLVGLCRELRGQERAGCQQAINAAVAACAGAAGRGELNDCADASARASEVCEALLPEGEAALCAEALGGLEGGEELGATGPPDGTNRGRIPGSANGER